MLDVDRLPAPAVLEALPIFPLPNVVFLPGMVLPLNVFEPRYLELVDHVLERGMHIGVPLLRPEESLLEEEDRALPLHDPGDERPAIEGIFGIGQIIGHQRLPDGRRFIRLEGLGRVRAREELPMGEHHFRRLAVEALPETIPCDHHALAVLEAQIERMAETFDDDEREMIRSVLALDDERIIVYAIASLIPNVELTSTIRHGMRGDPMSHLRLLQRCLAADDPDERVALLSTRAQRLIDVLCESDSFPVSSLN
ncbi:LON peptidase substrate-binding domain-containing protein [Pseudenhygromyxa sp. WMMC2535]|uniref:LON peptidase substrate-binding domain-containing protein n=1 Tax=Pseudenhygromyxa sp. WMMC2535 TaxID=2712867 RepID=UPI0015532549|nr:LON peptidase substrate-binding domain-containing protein [Pseudenhygromyxa sp. WMMC2535]NVB39001.1 LON peptidase substrate-binding domain-containing protein [Pseudenhygromyxa sp. WMMC2535]